MAPRTTTEKAGATKAPARSTHTRTARDTRSTAPRQRTNATAKATSAAATKASATVINKSGLPKLGKGGLETAVFDHMAANPKSEYTPTDLARVLSRSSGAIANALAKLAAQGKVTQTSERPRRYRLAGMRTPRQTSARKR